MTGTWPPAGSTAAPKAAGSAQRWGYEVTVDLVNDQWVGSLDGEEVVTRPSRVAAYDAAVSVAKRRYHKAHPPAARGQVTMLDDGPLRDALRGE